MSEMVERVAKLMFPEESDPVMDWQRTRVRELLEGMREPTEAMCEAARQAAYLEEHASTVWVAMIDAALRADQR